MADEATVAVISDEEPVGPHHYCSGNTLCVPFAIHFTALPLTIPESRADFSTKLNPG